MGILGWAGAGVSGLGPSSVYDSLPWKNWREVSNWLEEFVDAIGIEFDLRNRLFIGSAKNGATPERANLLDPTYTPAFGPFDTFATATAPPNQSGVKDTMLDVLLYVAGIPWPVDSILSTAQRQALVQVGWNALRRKGTRRSLLNLVSKVTDAVVYGWTNPPYTFSFILADGAGSGGTGIPGWGLWVPTASNAISTGTATFTNGSATVTGSGTTFTHSFLANQRISADGTNWYVIQTVTDDTHITLTQNFAQGTTTVSTYYSGSSASSRPPLLQAVRNLTQRISPAWSSRGVGYSQFRAGYSAAGETVFPSGARLNLFAAEHFAAWSGGSPTSWSVTGTATETIWDAFINQEFTSSACTIDLTGQSIGTSISAFQQVTHINNQIAHRLEVDYCYANAVGASTLTLQLRAGSNTLYFWNPSTSIWTVSTCNVPLPPCTPTTLAGTLSVTNGSASVTGTGTLFTSQLLPGQQISVDKNTWYYVQSIASDTSLTLTANFGGSTASAATAYSIKRVRYSQDFTPQNLSTAFPLTGTISLTSGSATVTGSSTVFTAQLSVGQVISTDKLRWYTVSSIASDTSLTLATNALTSATAVAGYFSNYDAATTVRATFSATSDGTLTTQQRYTFYRVGLYEKYDDTVEVAASGERTLWLPSVDAPGWTNAARAAGNSTVESANADRSAYRVLSSTTAGFPYHPALTGRSFSATSTWTNLLKGSNDFVTDWTLTNCTSSTNAVVSPAVADTSNDTTRMTHTSATATVAQSSVVADPHSKSYVGGVWFQFLSSGTATVTLKVSSGATVKASAAYSVTSSQGWQLLVLPPQTFGGGDNTALTFTIQCAAANGNQFALASSYLYDVTGKTGVMYPPVCQTAIGSTGTVGATSCQAITYTQGTDVKHPLLQRNMVTLSRGALSLVIIPTFDAGSQPTGVIFSASDSSGLNRIKLSCSSSALTAEWSDGTHTKGAPISTTTSLYPAAGYMTWLRDTPITVKLRWDTATGLSLSAGGGSATNTAGSVSPTDSSAAIIAIGNDYAGANQFDGMISNIELIQIGAPSS